MRVRTVAALGAAAAAYALVEPYRFELTEHRVPVATSTEVTVLHLSDTHMAGSTRALHRFLTLLPDRLPATPDLTIATGDLIEDGSGIDLLVESFAPLDARLGRFYVLGSHDYYSSSFRNYAKYFTGKRELIGARLLNTQRLEEGLQGKGWTPLTNTSVTLEGPGGRIRLSGVDDPYLRRHRTAHIGRERGDDLAIGLVHAPDVVSEWVLNGFDLVLAGHTHAGQVRLPGIGALVTNSTLPAALAGGLHRIGRGWLHVSPGLGQGRLSPMRFNCRPQATLLRLEPRSY